MQMWIHRYLEGWLACTDIVRVRAMDTAAMFWEWGISGPRAIEGQ